MLAIIPARGGSKGVPRKNVKLMNGKPLIYYTIKAALQSQSVTRVIVSTDDLEIADVARSCGAEVPFMRPAHLATDNAIAMDTYLYVIDELQKKEAINIDAFMVLQPTSPLRTENDIDGAFQVYKNNYADSVISVVEADYPPEWLKYLGQSGVIKNYFEDIKPKNRQDYPTLYLPNGAVYIFKVSSLKKTKAYYTEQSYPYVMQKENSIDIDTIFDFQIAEYFLKKQKNP